MKEIDFTKLQICSSFEEEAEGKTHSVDVAKSMGNLMKFSGPVLMDIEFEDLAKEIYYSKGKVKINERFVDAIIGLLEFSTFSACTKRAIREALQ